MVELTLQFAGDGVGEVDPQDGPRPPLAPPSPLAPHHGGQTAQVVDHPHSPCSTRPHFLCPRPSRLATQGGTGGAGLGSWPATTPSHQEVSTICLKRYAALASKRPKHSFYSKILFYAARIKVRFFCRFLFLTEEKRLVMPPGSQLVLTPTLALPFLRWVPISAQRANPNGNCLDAFSVQWYWLVLGGLACKCLVKTLNAHYPVPQA